MKLKPKIPWKEEADLQIGIICLLVGTLAFIAWPIIFS